MYQHVSSYCTRERKNQHNIKDESFFLQKQIFKLFKNHDKANSETET